MKTKNTHKRTTFTMIITTIDNINNTKSQWTILTWGWSHSNIPRGADALQWPNFTSFLITSLDAIPSNCSDFLRLEIYLRKKKQHTEGLTNVCGIMYVHIIPIRIFDLFQLGLFRARTNIKKRLPTGGRQTSWLYASTLVELNQGLLRSNLASGQSRT